MAQRVDTFDDSREITEGEAIEMVFLGFIYWCEGHQTYHVCQTFELTQVDTFVRNKRGIMPIPQTVH